MKYENLKIHLLCKKKNIAKLNTILETILRINEKF